MNITLDFEAADRSVSLTFILTNEFENEWDIDYNYIEVSEDEGPKVPRTWRYLNETYDPGVLAQLRHDAIAWAIDNYDPEEDHLLDDEGD